MKCSLESGRARRILMALPLAAVLVAGALARGALSEWAQHIARSSPFDAILFRHVATPSGFVAFPRSPAQTEAILKHPAASLPANAAFYRIRARVEEQALDFSSAETDWKTAARLSKHPIAGELALARFYDRRLRPRAELRALSAVAEAPATPAELLQPVADQRSWLAFKRIFAVIHEHALPTSVAVAAYQQWIARYPKQVSVYDRAFNYFVREKQFDAGRNLIAQYEKTFPNDHVFPIRSQASLEYARGSTEAALALYDRKFEPLWPPELIAQYFRLLKKTHRLRAFLASARAEVAAHPHRLSAAARIFYYDQQEGNLPAAQQALAEYRERMESGKVPWRAPDLWALGRLFAAVQDDRGAARCYYALYSLPGASDADAQKSLAAIIRLMFDAANEPLPLGSADFSMVRDIGALDAYPGFLNGIASLLLNSQQPRTQYAQASAASVAYFHRVEAAKLLALFDRRFPQASERASLHAKLIDVYSQYGDSSALIAAARAFLKDFPQSSRRVRIALTLADALASEKRVNEELAVYDQLLSELAARANHVPLGQGVVEKSPYEYFPWRNASSSEVGAPRSADYARVLNRYIARLVQLGRPMQALALFRRQLDQNPNDPGLYERLAEFLEQNHLGSQTENVYREAMKRFPGETWTQKLARWYLRYREMNQFEALSRQVIHTFSGADLDNYFERIVVSSQFDWDLYHELNLYAHQRFPHDLVFVRNLLEVDSTRPTVDWNAWENLIGRYWYEDPDLRSEYFSYLASHGDFETTLDEARALAGSAALNPDALVQANPAVAEFLAEADLWRCKYESAAPTLRALAAAYPTDFALDRRASNLYRSLAAFHPQDTAVAVGIEASLAQYEPGNPEILTRIGDIYADRSQFAQATPYWNRIPLLDPGETAGYLKSATIFWDYFRYADTLRLIREARTRFAKPALFAYQAGAVYEDERQDSRAVEEYVRGALAAKGESESRTRLLALAKRPKLTPIVDLLTADAARGRTPTLAAVNLRIQVLTTLKRRNDLETFLTALAANTPSLAMLQRISAVASQQGFDALEIASLQREIALDRDPVEQMRMELNLAQVEESKRQTAAARKTIESLYAAQPKILGVVRATVDFYWRNKLPDLAIQTLLSAAQLSYPSLKTQFTFEAARKATLAGEFDRARALLEPLLAAHPSNAQDLAALADTYAREKNEAGLRDFYLAEIKRFESISLPPDQKKEQIAGMRRGLIAALTELKDYTGAVDQYIEILNRYSEDAGLTDEVAAYADAHSLDARVLDYYKKTAAESPRDYRWPMVLARLESYFEDDSGAIAYYQAAHRIRPDRTDLLIEQAALEERLMRFDDAAATYTTLYRLTYQDPQWMLKLAAVRARQGETAAAVAALQAGLIGAHAPTAALDFEAASQLEQWNMLKRAQAFAEKGAALAGKHLLTRPEHMVGAETYARVMTCERAYPAAIATLESAADVEYPTRTIPALQAALQAMGQAVKTYFTPEERAAMVAFLQQQRAIAPQDVFNRVLLPLAEDADLGELEAQWRFEMMMASPGTPEANADEGRLVELRDHQMEYGELGGELEQYWGAYPYTPDRNWMLDQAAAAYRAAGDQANEFRVLGKAFRLNELSGDSLDRYFRLLLQRDPSQLVEIAGDSSLKAYTRNAAADFAIKSGASGLAFKAIAARGEGLTPVWSHAYTALVGLYYSQNTPQVDAAFQAALGDQRIGQRIEKPTDRTEHLSGEEWFPYASRYGAFLAVAHKHGADDDLAATLEAEPANPNAYFRLAQHYDHAGNIRRALADYNHVLELDPNRGDALDRMADLEWRSGNQQEAIARWKQAIMAFGRQQNASSVPPTFWPNVKKTFEDVGAHHALASVKPDADRLLRVYIKRNGSYDVDPLLKGVMRASANPAEGVEWILDLSQAAQDPDDFLSDIEDASWIPAAARQAIWERRIALEKDRVAKSHGDARYYEEGSLRSTQFQYIAYLLDIHQVAQAQAAFAGIPKKARQANADQANPLEVRIAAAEGGLDPLLARFDKRPNHAPSEDQLRKAAMALEKGGDKADARKTLEWMYSRAIAQRDFTSGNFLGLAEIRLSQGNTAEAVALLRRMTLVGSQPFLAWKQAGAFLLRHDHPQQAAEFLSRRVEASPWDTSAKFMLAKAEAESKRPQAPSLLAAIAGDRTADYTIRAQAAEALAAFPPSAAHYGSAELDVLARGRAAGPAAAEQPFFVAARLEAAGRTHNLTLRAKLLRTAIAIAPNNAFARIAFFRAAYAVRQYRPALSAIEPVVSGDLTPNSIVVLVPPHALLWILEKRSYIARLFKWISAPEPPGTTPLFSGSSGDRARQAQLAREIARAEERIHRLNRATKYFRLALRLEPSKPVQLKLKSKLAAIRSEIRLEARDAARRPTVTVEVVQRNLVRPRLLPLIAQGGLQ